MEFGWLLFKLLCLDAAPVTIFLLYPVYTALIQHKRIVVTLYIGYNMMQVGTTNTRCGVYSGPRATVVLSRRRDNFNNLATGQIRYDITVNMAFQRQIFKILEANVPWVRNSPSIDNGSSSSFINHRIITNHNIALALNAINLGFAGTGTFDQAHIALMFAPSPALV